MQPVSFLTASLLRFKSSSVMLGAMYVIAFIIIFPYILSLHLPVPSVLEFTLALAIAVGLISFLFNWAYIAVMAAPTAAALVMFFLGWAMYILSPVLSVLLHLVFMLLNAILNDLGGGGATGSITAALNSVTAVGDHIGQFFFTVGTGIYAHAKIYANKLNYVAIGTFITIMALCGVAVGLTGLSGVAMFLVIWLLFYLRMQGASGEDAIADLKRIFQLVATLVILTGTGVLNFSFTYLSHLEAALPFAGAEPHGQTFLQLWKWLWCIGMLVATWKPQLLWRLVPSTMTGKFKGFITQMTQLSSNKGADSGTGM